MKLFNKRRISVVLMTSIILLHGVSPLLAVATTVDSSMVESSTADTSNVESPEVVPEEIPAREDQVTEPEYVDVESNYGENELSAEYQESSAQPAVHLTEKNLTNEVTFEGEILAGIEQQENHRTETHLTKLVLQYSESNDSWEDIYPFEIEGNSLAIQAEKYAFDFSKSLDEVKAGNYRLIAEYDIQEYQEDHLVRVNHHKGMFVVGEVEEKNDENEVKATLPKLYGNQASNQLGIQPFNGIGTLALTPGEDSEYKNILNGDFVKIAVQKKTAKLSFSFNYADYASNEQWIVVWNTNQNYLEDVISLLSPPVAGKTWIDGAVYDRFWSDGKAASITVTSDGTKVQSAGGGNSGNMTGLTPNTHYYAWVFKRWYFDSNNPAIPAEWRAARVQPPVHGAGDPVARFEFHTGIPESLGVNIPTFKNPTHNSITMNNGTYTGDIRQAPSQGLLTIKGGPSPKTYPINHGYGTGGNYYGITAGDLLPGTRYRGEVTLYDYYGNPKTTGVSEEFQTANTIEMPDSVTALGTPNQQNDATASISVRYGATPGVNGSHPRQTWDDVEVEISKTGPTTGFYKLTSSTAEGRISGTPTVDQTTPKVSFTIVGLTNRRTYWVRCRVKNQSNVWSQYPTEGRGFTTKCIPLNIPPPTFDTDTITSHSITFEDGDYTGDITTTPNQGILTVTDGLTPIEYTLNHQTIYNGTYFGRVADNLQPGTRYRGNVTLTDYDGNTKASSLSEEFQTANTVETPHLFTLGDPPELGNEATVTLTARYGAADGSKGAHPEDYTWDSANNSWKNVQVEISKTGDETGFNRITDGTPEGRISHLEPPVVDTINKTVTFKVSKLAIKQDYWIRCQVRNQSGKWSGYPTKGKYIRTPGLKLTLNAPKFKQDTATDTSIDMEGQQYFGDITQFNGGGIVTVTPNNGGILENKVTNLMHMQNQGNSWNPQFYGSVTIGNLEPGTQYKGKVSIKDSIEEYRHSPWGGKDGIDTFFYTKNRVMALSEPMQETPTSINGAVATFTAGYKAADSNPAYVPAHPTKVKVYLSTDDNSFDEITTSSLGPRLVADNNIDTLNKLTTFRLEGLQENTVYFVKYSVVNDGGESAKSTSYRFETLSRPDGLYINESAADFNFGTVGFSSSNSTHPLEDTSGNETAVDFENININSNWSLSAKLSELKVEGETHLKLVGSSITMNNQLERSTDGGTTWTSADSTKFASGLNTTGPITLMADGSTSVELFKTTDISYGQSRFKNKIPLSSVSLFIPGNQGMKGKTYEGKITWTLDDTL
ncbi:WxL domain-containing protein [Enterococcus pallens]|uniref:WxL domain-containing protein n=1 Tax=Enterococcus pallens ATCC BAA-351 TaxID=1158607 RepID=R2QBC1_9ENTE|nr:WxL domain-containing protein [Enterococcus pallens]EOH93737.1 hypothetical protein UAU_02433 [Enterococcus pallens ATCC BAA-351]